MRNGKIPKISAGKVLIFLILISLVLLGLAVYFGDDLSNQEVLDPVGQTESTNVVADPTIQPDVTGNPTEIAPTETLTQPSEPDETEATETSNPGEIAQKADAEYEKWLAAAVVVGVSMEYPDFIPDAIYCASKTSLDEKDSSDGVYFVFASNGATVAIHSKPISAERSEAGTKDISSETIGFATFDLVDPAGIHVDSMDPIALEDLGELIAQSLLISIYTH